MADVVRYCPVGETRASGHCGLHHRPTTPHCRHCGWDLTMPGHEDH